MIIGLSPDTAPHADNRLSLSSQQLDSFGLPIPNLQLRRTDVDLRTIAFAKELASEISVEMGGDEELSFGERIHSHPAGLCRMGSDNEVGVVDGNNKVFGTENLYVSGACVFPTSGATNPTNTVVALTLRLADHLIERHRSLN